MPGHSEDAIEAARQFMMWVHERKRRFTRLFEDNNGWYGIEEIAERDPAAFLREIWTPFVRALESILDEPSQRLNRFRKDHSLAFELSDGEGGPFDHPFPNAIDHACRKLASNNLSEFIEFLAANDHRDIETVQRLLARGLTAGLPATREQAVQFLLEDSRRLELGPFRDEFRDSISLLGALAPILTDDELHLLEVAILGWNCLDPQDEPSTEWRFRILRINRHHRLRLLGALPQHRLTESTRNLIGQERVRFSGDPEPGIHLIQGGMIGSPMSSEQMVQARNSDIVNLFQELTDVTDHTHPRDHMQGGSRQASHEFETFAVAHPDRAIAVIREFQPGRQEFPAGAGLLGLAKARPTPTNDVLFDLVVELNQRGFCSESFRVDAARAVGIRNENGTGLPDRICDLFEKWLSEPWRESGAVRSHSESKDDERPRSVLWHKGGVITIPHGTFTLLETLTYGYLFRRPPDYDRWISMLEAHVDRPENVWTWQVLSREFKYLSHGDRPRAVRFFDRLFERHPAVLGCDLGAAMLTWVWRFAPEADVWRWLSSLRDSSWAKAGQAYGELVMLRAAVFGTERHGEEVRAYTDPTRELDENGIAVAEGIAVACSRLWSDATARAHVTDIMVRLISWVTGPVARAILDVFTFAENLPPDVHTKRLLAAIAARPAVLVDLQDGWIAERLEGLLPAEAESICLISKELARVRRAELGAVGSSWSQYAANLTTISLTLQRLDKPLREQGIELFESLLESGIHDAESAVREMDQRIPNPINGFLPRPRLRRGLRA